MNCFKIYYTNKGHIKNILFYVVPLPPTLICNQIIIILYVVMIFYYPHLHLFFLLLLLGITDMYRLSRMLAYISSNITFTKLFGCDINKKKERTLRLLLLCCRLTKVIEQRRARKKRKKKAREGIHQPTKLSR